MCNTFTEWSVSLLNSWGKEENTIAVPRMRHAAISQLSMRVTLSTGTRLRSSIGIRRMNVPADEIFANFAIATRTFRMGAVCVYVIFFLLFHSPLGSVFSSCRSFFRVRGYSLIDFCCLKKSEVPYFNCVHWIHRNMLHYSGHRTSEHGH